jgi:(1->4)-alpha-D-glucan 1-alpha-D-glucosylmutase
MLTAEPPTQVAPQAGVLSALPPTRIPRATYRVQLNRHFTFQDARRLAGYWRDLGISDLYTSPYLKASTDSTHGYDVTDHGQLNPGIGSADDEAAMAAALRRHGLGQVLDIVPNHMGIAEAANRWWMNVLENGPASPYASFFDISWDAPQANLNNRVLLPILGDQYGAVLENGELRLAYADGAFFLHYYDTLLPITPNTYGVILERALERLAQDFPPDDEQLVELQSILTAISHLPPTSVTDLAQVAEREREKEVVKRRLAALTAECPELRSGLETGVAELNGQVGQPASFDRLDVLLDQQPYRLAFWRVASEEINYRRFFDINELAAIRVERPEVFRETHRLVLELLRAGHVTGLRIDHPDGLRDPAGYLRMLQEAYRALWEVGEAAEAGGDREMVRGSAAPLYVVVEKILSYGEELPVGWPVHGTTGYDFGNSVGGLFVDGSKRRAFDELYARFIGRRIDFRDLVNSAKKMIMLVSLASEVNTLATLLDRVTDQHRRFRDFTQNSLTFAIREVMAALPVYRTYSSCDQPISKRDRDAIEAAVAEARRRNPRTDASIFHFIRDLLLLRYPAGDGDEARQAQCEFVLKFQQTTGPVMAKGVEDTIFYVYNRLVSLNEVGGEPDRFGRSVAEFHRDNLARLERWPHAMLATSTHDTKRSEDVRARISVLSELPREWSGALGRWRRLNARHRRRVDGYAAPDRNDEYLIYQTLLGVWPFESLDGAGRAELVSRVQSYLQKATREAKVHTSWINPNQEYDQAVADFIAAMLDPRQNAAFLSSFEPLRRRVAHVGVFNSLAQTLLKLTSPGVPDIYQGTELWDFSLVDPDNRRPVDYERRVQLLRELRTQIARRRGSLAGLAKELLASREDGRVKLYLTQRALQFRSRHPELFESGSYQPLEAEGVYGDRLVAFSREHEDASVVVVTPRLLATLVRDAELPLGSSVWGDTWLDLAAPPGERYRDLFSGLVLQSEAPTVEVG